MNEAGGDNRGMPLLSECDDAAEGSDPFRSCWPVWADNVGDIVRNADSEPIGHIPRLRNVPLQKKQRTVTKRRPATFYGLGSQRKRLCRDVAVLVRKHGVFLIPLRL